MVKNGMLVVGPSSDCAVADRQRPEYRADNQNTPFFIIGSIRSGTTLLRLILSSHSRLHIPPESWFIEDLVRELPLTARLTPDQVERVVSLISGHRRWEDFKLSSASFRQQLAELPSPTLREIIDLVYREELADTGKARFGDKTPPYFRIVEELLVLYPGAKFIHLIRDGRDVAISCVDSGVLHMERYYNGLRFAWLEAMKWREAHRLASYAGQILEIRYEDLINKPEATVRSICAFLGEAFEEKMLGWQQHVDNMIPQREMHMHRRISGSIDRENVAVWKTRLTPFECFSMEACMYVELERLGYPLRFSGRFWRPLLWLWGRILNVLAPHLLIVLPALRRRKLLKKPIYF